MNEIPGNISLAARRAYTKYNVLASVQLAQWILESAWGMRPSGKNNPFGIKAKVGTPKTTHEVVKNGQRIQTVAIFKDFTSIDEAFDYHADMLRYGKPYLTCKPYLADYHMYCHLMGHIYATDPQYGDKLISLIDEYKLTQYDVKIIDNATPVVIGAGSIVAASTAVIAKTTVHHIDYTPFLIGAGIVAFMCAVAICLYLWANRTKPQRYSTKDLQMFIAAFQSSLDQVKQLVAEKSAAEADLQQKLDAANAQIASMQTDVTDTAQAFTDALGAPAVPAAG